MIPNTKYWLVWFKSGHKSNQNQCIIYQIIHVHSCAYIYTPGEKYFNISGVEKKKSPWNSYKVQCNRSTWVESFDMPIDVEKSKNGQFSLIIQWVIKVE